MPKPEFPITFDLVFEGKTLSSHKAKDAEEMRTLLAAARKVHDPGVEIGNYTEWEPRLADVPDLVALRLATVYCDQSTSLVSLTHQHVIADCDDADSFLASLPHVHLTGKMERAAAAEYFGLAADSKFGEGWPGWPAVFAYLDNHPEVFDAPTDSDEDDEDDEDDEEG